VCLIRLILARGQTVLVTAYTNSALENILLKCLDLKIDFLRVGNCSVPNKAKLYPYTTAAATKTAKNVDELTGIYDSKVQSLHLFAGIGLLGEPIRCLTNAWLWIGSICSVCVGNRWSHVAESQTCGAQEEAL